MRRSALVAVAIVAFLAVTTVLVNLGRDGLPRDAALTDGPSATSSSSAPAGTGETSAAPSTAAPRPRAASTVLMTAVKEGEKPPQWVLFSLDGAGSHDIWQRFFAAAAASDARFTAFLSGTYLLDDAHAAAYTGPGHAPGTSSTGFGGTPEDVATEVADLSAAYLAGHEIGTLYNGHFCAGNPPSGDDWSTADWNAELGQFFRFLTDWQAINGYSAMTPLPFGKGDIKGGRTPCLEGDLAALEPAWKAHGFTYDTSKNLYTGIAWPKKLDSGVWEFQLPYVYSKAFGRNVIPMNYNLWALFNGAKEDPGSAPQLRASVKGSYQEWFDAVYKGNRAPLVIETQASLWNGDSFVPPALDLMREVCVKDDVICATYSEAVAWLEAQDPKTLADWQARPAVATGP